MENKTKLKKIAISDMLLAFTKNGILMKNKKSKYHATLIFDSNRVTLHKTKESKPNIHKFEGSLDFSEMETYLKNLLHSLAAKVSIIDLGDAKYRNKKLFISKQINQETLNKYNQKGKVKLSRDLFLKEMDSKIVPVSDLGKKDFKEGFLLTPNERVSGYVWKHESKFYFIKNKDINKILKPSKCMNTLMGNS